MSPPVTGSRTFRALGYVPRSSLTASICPLRHRTKCIFLFVYLLGPQAAVRLSKDFDKRLRRFMVRRTPCITPTKDRRLSISYIY